jgi:putative cardiolipin synthase
LRVLAPFELFRVAEFAIDGNRLNHRMHNKLLVADNKLAILGGRNIGDDYFGFSTRRNFIDTDILLSGPVVGELSDGFDDYWNSRWAYPVEELASFSVRKDDLELLRGRIDKRLAEHPQLLEVLNETDFMETMERLCSGFPLREAGTVIDDPEVRWFERPDDIAADLAVIAKTVEREVLVVSPYFVPTENMFQIAKELNERGVKIVIATNSLASNDIVIAHSAYARFRKAILKAGVELYEMRGEPRLAEGDRAEIASLHSKYIIFDDDVVFIGSLNLDPRSLYLNTELGVMLRSPELADALRSSFQELIRPENSWRITMEDGGLRWSSTEGVVKKEPAKSHWQNIQNKLMRTLPLADQL